MNVFLHEVGLFLGYPLDDVAGFIEQKGKKLQVLWNLEGLWR